MLQVHEFAILVDDEPSPLVRVGGPRSRLPKVTLLEEVAAQAGDKFVDGHLGEGDPQMPQLGRPDGRVPVDDVLARVAVHKDASREFVLVPGDLQRVRVAYLVGAEGDIGRDHLDHGFR